MIESGQNELIKKLLLIQGLTVAVPFVMFKVYTLKIITNQTFGALAGISYSLSMYLFGLLGLFVLLYSVIAKDDIDRPYRYLSYLQFMVSFFFYFFCSDTSVF